MSELVRYEAACRALAECKAVDEVKAWADKAAAMQAYGRMAQDKGLEIDAAEIRIRAERRLGEMLAHQKADGGLNSGVRMAGKSADGSAVVCDDRRSAAPKLAEAGISKDLSSRAQKLAAVPEAEFEAEVGGWRERVSAEGARVSARLQQAGERALKAAPEPDQGIDDFDPLAELERAHKEIETLTGEIKAAEADDAKVEAMKWRRAYDAAQRAQSDAMERFATERRLHDFKHRALMRCGKAIGVSDPDKIAPAIEAFVRNQRAVA